MPTPTTKTRQALKARFVRGAIPTEEDFSDLIEASLSQADDGLFKLPDEPLSLVRQKPDQPVLRFFENPSAAGSAWEIHLAAEEQPGFSVANQDGKVNLFIDSATGNVGVGTTTPAASLTVESDLLELARSTDPQSNLAYSGTLAIKSARPQIDFIQAGGTIDWAIRTFKGDFHIVQLPAASSVFCINGKSGNVGIGVSEPQQKLQVDGDAGMKSLQVDDLWIKGKRFIPEEIPQGKVIELANGNVGINEQNPAARLSVYSEESHTMLRKDMASQLAYGGQLAIKAPSPQLDFITPSNGAKEVNWALRVSKGRMLFIRSPWHDYDFVLDGLGFLGIGTRKPINRTTRMPMLSKLHVVGGAGVKGLIIDNKWMLGRGYSQGVGPISRWLFLLDPRRENCLDGTVDDVRGGLAAQYMWSYNGFVQTSDVRLKDPDSIREAKAGLPRIMQLAPVEFCYKTEQHRKTPRLGFIAQDLEPILPEAVVDGPDGIKGIHTGCLIALIAKAIKEQDAHLNGLQAQIRRMATDVTIPSG
jgi:hypothetical protein